MKGDFLAMGRDRSPGSEYRRRTSARAWLTLCLGLLLSVPALTYAAGRVLKSVNVQQLPGDGARITLTLSTPAPQPQAFTVNNPASLSLDLPNTANGLANRYQDIDTGPAHTLAVIESHGRTRVVLSLNHMVPYDIQTQGNRVIVTLDGPSAGVHAQTDPASGGQSQISGIDFRRGENGAGRVIVHLKGPNTAGNVHDNNGNVVIDFAGATVADRLIQRLDVLDFATPVKYIETRRQPDGVEITVIPRDKSQFERTAYQTDDQFTLELLPHKAAAGTAGGRQTPTYTGKRISLNFQNIGIRPLLQIIADVAEVNMVVSDTVSGTMALRLDNVPWDQALDIILTTQGLGKTRVGNVIMVAPLKEIAARQAAQFANYNANKQLVPLHSEIIQINYAKASEIASLLQSSNNSFLSSRGRVSVDERTNTLLVQDVPDKIKEIRHLINRIDIPVRQVLIASRIVIANNDFARDLGTRFGLTIGGGDSNGLITTTTGSAAGASGILSGIQGGGDNQSVIAGTALDNRFNVSLPAAPKSGNAGRLAFGILGSDYLIDLELSALQAEGRGEVVSSPRVITANAQEATIEQGVEIPYQEAASSGATSVSFKKAVLSLKVTPQITPDGRIIMDLAVNKDSVGQQVSDGRGGSVPAIDTRRVSTRVLVNDGDTVVLGGIYEQERNRSVSKIPLLGDIPLLGALFRNTHVDTSKAELLIFVTPKILKDKLRID